MAGVFAATPDNADGTVLTKASDSSGADAYQDGAGMEETPRHPVKSVERKDDAVIVSLTGEIDMNNSPLLHQKISDLLRDKPPRLLFDLSEVTYMDSSGIGTLVDALRKVRAYGGKLALVGVTQRVKSILQITKLTQFFDCYETLEEALAK